MRRAFILDIPHSLSTATKHLVPLATAPCIRRLFHGNHFVDALQFDRLLDGGNGGDALLRRGGVGRVGLDEEQAVGGVFLLELVRMIWTAKSSHLIGTRF